MIFILFILQICLPIYSKGSPFENLWLDQMNYIPGFINSNGEIGFSKGIFRVYYLPVEKGERYRLLERGGKTIAVSYCLYSSEPDSFNSNTAVIIGEVIKDQFQENIINIADETIKYLAVTWFKEGRVLLQKEESLGSSYVKARKMDNNNTAIFSDIRSIIFEKQQVCLHHDNFYRTVTDLEWHIGSNDPTNKTMNYNSPRADYNTQDDGFRIVDNCLTNNRNVGIEKSFRIIDAYTQLKEEFFVELANVKKKGSISQFVFNYINEDNYEAFRFEKKLRKTSIYYVIVENNMETKEKILKAYLKGKNIKIQFNTCGIRLYSGDELLENKINRKCKVKLSNLRANNYLPVALYVDTHNDFEYGFINIYNVAEKTFYSRSEALKNIGTDLFVPAPNLYNYAYKNFECINVEGIYTAIPDIIILKDGVRYINSLDNCIYIYNGSEWLNEGTPDPGTIIMVTEENAMYIYDYDDSGIATYRYQSTMNHITMNNLWNVERFELRCNDVHSVIDDRSECSETYVLYNNLRKKHISFDILLPVDYTTNAIGSEALLQFQLRGDFKEEVRQPAFTISTTIKDGTAYWYSNQRSIPSKWKSNEQIIRHDDNVIGECNLGAWTHFDIYMQEGYDKDHSSLLIVKKDGQEVINSTDANTWNDVHGLYIRYGIYKSEFLYGNNNPIHSRRVVYFANFKLES